MRQTLPLVRPDRAAAPLSHGSRCSEQLGRLTRLTGIESNGGQALEGAGEVPDVSTFPQPVETLRVVSSRGSRVARLVADQTKVAQLVAETLLVAELPVQRESLLRSRPRPASDRLP